MSEDMKKEMRQLIMLISSIRSQDQDHWESHIAYSQQVIDFMQEIKADIEKNWDKVNVALEGLDNTIQDAMESILTGINPQAVKETSVYLKEIQDSMQKSMMSMNLEAIMQDLNALASGGVTIKPKARSTTTKKATPITSAKSSPYASTQMPVNSPPSADTADLELDDDYTPEEIEMIKAYQEIYGEGTIPEHLKKKKQKEDPHLLKPSDFFG